MSRDPTQHVHVLKIVSGGQTGVDRGALDAAIELGIPHGGWCPRGRLAEDGRIPDRYALQECTSQQYSVRTEQNVIDSDATLIICRRQPLTGGTRQTREFAIAHRKPYHVVELDEEHSLDEIRRWLTENRVTILNVAGPRESQSPGIQNEARGFLHRVMSHA